mgnify:CR=1 FL=1
MAKAIFQIRATVRLPYLFGLNQEPSKVPFFNIF